MYFVGYELTKSMYEKYKDNVITVCLVAVRSSCYLLFSLNEIIMKICLSKLLNIVFNVNYTQYLYYVAFCLTESFLKYLIYGTILLPLNVDADNFSFTLKTPLKVSNTIFILQWKLNIFTIGSNRTMFLVLF